MTSQAAAGPTFIAATDAPQPIQPSVLRAKGGAPDGSEAYAFELDLEDAWNGSFMMLEIDLTRHSRRPTT